MLLLVTIVLVLIAAVTLLIGIFGDNLALIFVSIGASALAAIVLAVLSQMSRRRARDTTASDGPKPLPTDAPAPADASTAPAAQVPPEEPTLVDAPLAAPAQVPAAVAGAGTLPIENYDSLRVNEILPRLEGLGLDELELVAQREESTKNRTTILNRIDDLMDQLEAQGATAAPAAVPAGAVDAQELAEEIESGDVVPEERVSDSFPIAGFESLSEDEVIARIADLDADQLEEVAEYEETHANRDRVLDAIDDRLDELEGVAPAATTTAAPAKRAVAKKAAAKKATVKKATTKKAASKKTAALPAVAASRATTAKKATKKAGVKKALGTSTVAPAKKLGAATKRAVATKGATAKKAAAVKKTAKKATR